ncbi:MAG: hypothetical protein NT016_01435 [Candidatus Aenigmarchaeota archaeon]|nr:hypothetical protein [Candidatus Aenigmarchaeota archaeon]
MAIKDKLDKHQTGLVVGVFLGGAHALWALMVAVMPGILQQFLDWMFVLHSLRPYWIITTFDLANAVMLVVMTFVIGYAMGWVFACIWNCPKRGKR